MIIPDVALRLAGLERADGLFPVIDIVQSVAMGGTPAGEAHELGLHVGQGLCQVRPHAVLAALECVLREERDQVEPHFSFTQRLHLDGSLVGIRPGLEHGGHLLPFLLGCLQRGLRHHLPVLHEAHAYLSTFAFQLFGKQREVVFLSFPQHDAVESAIHQRHVPAFFHVHHGIMGIVLVNGISGLHFPASPSPSSVQA